MWQSQNLTAFLNSILQNTEKQIAQCESTVKEDSFECSNHKILSTESKFRTTLKSKDAIIHSGCQMVKILCFWSEVVSSFSSG